MPGLGTGPAGTVRDVIAEVAPGRARTAGITQRFAVVGVLIAVSALQLASGLIRLPYFPGLQDHANGSVGCVLAASGDPSAAGFRLGGPVLGGPVLGGPVLGGPVLGDSAAYNACQARYGWNPAWWLPLVVTAGLAVVAGLVYLRLARGRHRVMLAATGDSGGRLTGRLAGLTAIAGLDRPPRFVIDPAATRVSAVAHGLSRRHTVRLHGGLVARLESDPATFRAVVLHELAHVRNRDVGLTYATMAAWRVYVVALLLPTVISAAWVELGPVVFRANARSVFLPAERNLELKFLVTAAFLVLLVLLARADALRTREAYAGLAAARWDAAARSRAPAGSLAEDAARPGGLAWLASFLDLWRTHPGRRQRAVLEADPSAVFRVSALPTFLTGAAAMLILSQFSADTGSAFANGLNAYWPAVLAAVVLIAVTGVALWRAAAYAPLAGQRASSGLRAGLWLSLGLVAGELLEGITTFPHWWPADPAFLLALPLLGLVVTVWSAEFAACCARAGRRTARLAMTVGLVAVGAAVTAVLAWWQGAGELFASGIPVTSNAFLNALGGGPPAAGVGHHALLLAISVLFALPSQLKWPLTAAATALWTVPLAVGGATAWARRAVVAPRQLPAAVLAGVVGGLVSGAGGLTVMAYLHSWWIPLPEQSGTLLLAYSGLLAACVIAGMVLAAAAGAALGRDNRFLAALVATGVAGPLGIGAAYLLVGTDGCVAPLATMVNSCSWKPAAARGWIQLSAADTLAVGAVASAAAAILVVACVAAVTAWRASAARRSRAGLMPVGEPVPADDLPANASPASPVPTVPPAPASHALPAAAVARPPRVASIGRTVVAMVLTAAAVITLIAAGPSLSSGGSRSPASVSLLLPASTPVSSPQLTQLTVEAWNLFGGMPLMSDLDEDDRAVGPALSRVVAERAPGDRPDGQATLSGPPFKALAAPTARVCASVLKTVGDAEAYFPIPSPPLQRQWRELLAAVGAAARDCVTGAAKPDPQLFNSGAARLPVQGKPIASLMRQLTLVADRYCRACV